MRKIKSIIIVMIALILTMVVAHAEGMYESSFSAVVNYNGHTYALSNKPCTWNQAQEICEKNGGHLATITSMEEQKTIEKIIEESAQLEAYYLGGKFLNDSSTMLKEEYRQKWRWITDEMFSYNNWAENGSTWGGALELYVWYLQIYSGKYSSEKEFLWSATSSNGFQDDVKSHGFICEWDYEKTVEIKSTITTSFGATVSKWAAPEIEKAYNNGLIPKNMTSFDLTEKVNRGEFAAIAVQLYETLAKKQVQEATNCGFEDIQDDVNEQAIKKAYEIDVAQGTSYTTYEPLSNINREQLATMLCRVIKKYSFPGWTIETDDEFDLNIEGVSLFEDDKDISEWAKPSVYFMAKNGIVKGISATHFAPKNTTSQQEASGYASATREQAIILAQRIFEKSGLFGN